MFAGRLARVVPSFVAALLLVVLGLVAACDDPPEVRPEDRNLRLGTSSGSICPSLTTPVPHTGQTTVLATVFADDGQVAAGVPVTFSTSDGTLDSTLVETDQNGQAKTTLTVGRQVDDPRVTLTAMTDNGLTSTRSVIVPYPPVLVWAPSTTTPTVGSSFTMGVVVQLACNVRRIEGAISWDDSKVNLVGDCLATDPDDVPWIEGNILNDVDGSGNVTGTTVTCTPSEVDAEGRRSLTFSYTRDEPFETDDESVIYGSSTNGTYLGFRFTGVATGPADFEADGSLTVTPAEGTGFGQAYDTSFDGTSLTSIGSVTVQAASSSLRRGR